ncbi:MAG TPA: tetratricopeptide repeat protein [Kiritimatiellae bacterium]|nr:tetratricopeptide repeat protein [Kiritimatiellia bacterium]
MRAEPRILGRIGRRRTRPATAYMLLTVVWYAGVCATSFGAEASPAKGPGGAVERTLATGEAALKDGLWSLAEMEFRKLLDQSLPRPLENRAAIGLVRALCGRGAYREALQVMERYRRLRRSSIWGARYRLWKAVALEGSGDSDKARRLAARLDAGSLFGADRAAYLLLQARLRLSEGKGKEAVRFFEEFDREFYSTPAAPLNLSWWAAALQRLGLTNQMAEVLNRLVTGYPRSEHAARGALWLSDELAKRGDRQEAHRILRSLARRQEAPDDARAGAWLKLAGSAVENGDYTNAVEWASEAARLARSVPLQDSAAWLRVRALVLAGRYEQAATAARKWVAENLGRPGTDQRYLEFAELLRAQKATQYALEEFTHFLELFPQADAERQARAWLGKGWCLYSLDRLAEAAAAFAKVPRPGVSTELVAEALLKRADTLFRAGKFEEARQLYLKFAADFSDSEHSPQARYQACECLARAGKIPEAQAELRKLASERADTPLGRRAVLRRGTLFQQSGQWEDAVETYTKFLERYPGDPSAGEALLGRGLALYRLGKFELARDDFLRVQEKFAGQPYAERAAFMLGWTLYLEGRRESAMDACRDFVQRYPESRWVPDVLFWMAERYYETGDLQSAQQTFSRISRDFPESPLADQALYWAGRSAMQRSDYVAARGMFTDLAEKYPRSTQLVYARFALGDVLTELGKFAEAVLVFDEIVRKFPGHRLADLALGRKGDCLYTLGTQDAGRYVEALKCYSALLSRPDVDPVLMLQARYKGARCLEKLGRLEEAFEQYMQVVYDYLADAGDLRGRGPEVWFARAAFDAASLREREGKWSEAIAVYKRVVDSGVAAGREAARRIRDIRLKHWLLM